ncbi:hypothetical protein FHW64_002403 [Variovorax sp. Sphag1AA]|nr:hypothetical protein [Variovorax sp. Sphag1AA]
MGRSPNPHRLFGQAFTATGVFGMLFLLMTGVVTERFGAAMLFRLFAGVPLPTIQSHKCHECRA